MSNITVNNSSAPANLSVFLATKKNLIPPGLAKKLKLYAEEYNRIGSERNKFTSDKAEEFIRGIRAKAENDPSSANLQEMSQLDPDSVRRRFSENVDSLSRIQDTAVKRSTEDVIQLRDVVLAVADAELKQIESNGHELAAKYGATFDPAQDPIWLQLSKWRTQAERILSKGTHPKRIVSLIGEIR